MSDVAQLFVGVLLGGVLSATVSLAVMREREKRTNERLGAVEHRQIVQLKIVRDIQRHLKLDRRSDDQILEWLMADLANKSGVKLPRNSGPYTPPNAQDAH